MYETLQYYSVIHNSSGHTHTKPPAKFLPSIPVSKKKKDLHTVQSFQKYCKNTSVLLAATPQQLNINTSGSVV